MACNETSALSPNTRGIMIDDAVKSDSWETNAGLELERTMEGGNGWSVDSQLFSVVLRSFIVKRPLNSRRGQG